MKEVSENLWVGNQIDWMRLEPILGENAALHAAKEPWHREFVRYSTKGAPKDSPEYLWALRGNRLALNLVDAADPKFILPEVIGRGIEFIAEHLAAGRKVFVHCNQGQSRSAGIAFLYLDRAGKLPRDIHQAMAQFRQVYPEFYPAAGMMGFIEFNFGVHGSQ